MKNEYRITVVDFNKLNSLPFVDSMKASYTVYVRGFDEVVKYIGGRPFRNRAGWSAMRGNTEYIVAKCK